jgi:hypothetical protein
MFCLVLRVSHSKSVNAIPSLCLYKLFQSFNYEIWDFFYDEGIVQKHVFRFLWNLHKCLDYNCYTLMY